jgi:ubiquinone/menaquinone biosynthesis C-methylase UbiE
MESIKQKEKEYHNKAFSEGTRKPLDKYYQITKRCTAFYQERTLAACKNKNALEYGCGPGSMAFHLVKLAKNVVGIDISEVAIEQAKARAENEGLTNASFFVMDAENLDFFNEAFDLICGSAILHHLNLDRALAEIARTLKSDGVAVFLEALGHNPLLNAYRRLTPRLRTEDEHPLLMPELKTADAYFGKVEKHFFNLLSLAAMPFHRFAGFGWILNRLDGADQFLFKRLPFTRKYAWIAVLVLSQPRK